MRRRVLALDRVGVSAPEVVSDENDCKRDPFEIG